MTKPEPEEFQLLEGVQVLRRTPKTLRALLEGLPGSWTDSREKPESWSPFDVVGHLILGDKTDWIPRAEIILEHGEATPFTPFERFDHVEVTRGKTMTELLDLFWEPEPSEPVNAE